MHLTTRSVCCYALFATFLLPLDALATGLLVPTDKGVPPLALKHHRVDIKVEGPTAVTTVDQVFYNHTNRALEATLVFPLPRQAVIVGAELTIGGKLVEGSVVERGEAQRIYTDIVRRMKDPALIEWLGDNLFQARVFPVPPRAEQRLRITYTESLNLSQGSYALTYPLRTPHAAATTLEDFTLTVGIHQDRPLGVVYSPTHRIDVNRSGAYKATIGFEGEQLTLDRDFTLFMGLADDAVGLSLLTHRPPGEPGYFLLMAAPQAMADLEARGQKDVTFVLDTSGSMRGEKLEQARAAIRWCLKALSPRDRFNVVRFASDVERFAPTLVPATPDQLAEARTFVSGFRAAGGTAIDAALKASLARTGTSKNPHLVIFITDGRPTVGETNPKHILAAAKPKTASHTRLFTLGVGDGLNAKLLDGLAAQLGGSSAYVGAEEAIDRHISALYAQVAHPVLTDITLDINGIRTFQTLPNPIGDLFKGGQLMLMGRYRSQGDALIRLRGRLSGQARHFDFEGKFPKTAPGHAFIANLWAHRQVGQLLEQARLHGETPELKREIVALATRFGIVTPYTSFLVLEPSVAGGRAPVRAPRPPRAHFGRGAGGGGVTKRGARSPEAALKATAKARVSGDLGMEAEASMLEGMLGTADDSAAASKRSVSRSKATRHLKEKRIHEADVSSVRHVAGRVFTWRDDQWRDQAWRRGMTEIHLAPYSRDWTRLAAKSDALRQVLALGERLTVVIGDVALVIRPKAPKGLSAAHRRVLGL